MVTNIQIDDRLFSQARELAEASGISLDAFIAQAVEESVKKRQPNADLKFSFTRDHGAGLAPGAELCNSAQLLDIAEEGLDVSHRR
jgi:predicted transcriptional regulator